MALTYFGLCDSAGDPTGGTSDDNAGSGVGIYNDASISGFQCPGSGSQTVSEIGFYGKVDSGTANLGLAVYDNAGNRLCANTTTIAMSNTTEQWVTVQAADISGTLTLTGGDYYRLVVYVDNATARTTKAQNSGGHYQTGSSWEKYSSFPATLPTGTAGYIWPVRVGVDLGGGGELAPTSGSLINTTGTVTLTQIHVLSSTNVNITISASTVALGGVIAGSTCWGHNTGVIETNVRTFAGNWSGTGSISGNGDTEKLIINEGQYMQSEVVNTGALNVTLAQNVYAAGDTGTIKFRHGATEAACLAATFEDYVGPFASLGFVQVRVEG